MDDGRLDLAKAIPLLEVASRLGVAGLRRAGVEHVGPCPVCGGKDRFGVNPALGVFICRVCDAGGDGLAMVQHVLACDFKTALSYLAGDADVQPDPAEVARRQARAAEVERKRADFEASARARAVADAREIWRCAQGADGTAVAAYLEARGIAWPDGALPPTLRFAPAHPYRKKAGGQVRTLHTGPAMIAAIQNAAGRITAVHQTWINPAYPGLKAHIEYEGEVMPAKMVRGSKKGGAIRLSPLGDTGVMIMGEGIETTASAITAAVLPGATYWAGIDLGNMAGRQIKVPGVRYSGAPDLGDDAAWIPPAGIKRLIFIQDGDSDPAATRAKLLCGLRRAQLARPGLEAQIVHPGAGVDLNDLARQSKNDGGAQ
jgi:hypothetical protein